MISACSLHNVKSAASGFSGGSRFCLNVFKMKKIFAILQFFKRKCEKLIDFFKPNVAIVKNKSCNFKPLDPEFSKLVDENFWDLV